MITYNVDDVVVVVVVIVDDDVVVGYCCFHYHVIVWVLCMMLLLRIPLPSGYKPTRKSSSRFVDLFQRRQEYAVPSETTLSGVDIIDITGNDPFVIENNVLTVL